MPDYLVPASLDIGELDAMFLDGHDPQVKPLGVIGLGENAAVRVAPAVANALHATGGRLRDLPMRADDLVLAR